MFSEGFGNTTVPQDYTPPVFQEERTELPASPFINMTKEQIADTILERANPAQREIITHFQSSAMCNATAGSGKTFSLVNRVKYLIEYHGVSPEKIALISFTNKSANEIKERIGSFYNIHVSTIHSFCNVILRDNKINLPMLDNKFQLFTVLKEFGIEEKVIGDIISFVSFNKSNNIRCDEVENYKFNKPFSESQAKFFYQSYERALRKLGRYDFNDILLKTYDLLIGRQDLQQKYANRWEYIMVDENQDSNSLTNKIIRMVAHHDNLVVVGDFAQSLYFFNGASPQDFINFPKEKNSKVIRLDTNYRSLPLIVHASNKFIYPYYEYTGLCKDAKSFRKKECIEGTIKVNDEIGVVDRIEQLIAEGENPKEIAILYRMNIMSESYEYGLALKGIPYVVKGQSGFFKQKDIKAIMGYIKLAKNEKDMEAFLSCFNTPNRYLGNKFIAEVDAILSKHDISIIKAMNYIDYWQFRKGMDAIRTLIQGVGRYTKTEEAIDYIVRNTKYKDYIMNSSDEENTKKERLELIEGLKNMAEKHPTIDELLEVEAKMTVENQEGVTLSTVHSSKGLEWKHVFVVEVNKDKFPDKRSRVEEEACVFYVAITRAADNLYVNGDSRFVYELEEILENRTDGWIDTV